MTKDLGLCWACDPQDRKPARHMHHVLPVSYGGKMDGQQVPLCPTCHDIVHQAERALIRGEPISPTLTEGQRTLAGYAAKQYQIHVETGGPASDARNVIALYCTPEEHALAHDLKRRMGFKSLERMFKQLMFQEYQRRRK